MSRAQFLVKRDHKEKRVVQSEISVGDESRPEHARSYISILCFASLAAT